MTVGSKVGFPGEAVPLVGNSEIRQSGSTAIDVVTITLSTATNSGAGGKGLVVSRSTAVPEKNSISKDPTVFEVAYDGARWCQHVISISTAACTYTLSASESGALVILGDSTAKDMTITLPAMESGLWYEIYQAGGVKASGAGIAAATAGTMVIFNDAAANSIRFGTSGTAIGGSVRVITDGVKWYTIMQPAMGSAALSTAAMTLFDAVT